MEGDFVARLASARIGATFNQYADSVLRRERLRLYLVVRADAKVVLVGEAAGYRGARVSGIAFGVEEDVLLWNVVPTHPGTGSSNRAPRRDEVEAAAPFLEEVLRGRSAFAVGRVAAGAMGAAYIRHPSHGGATAFEEGLERAFATIPRRRAGVRRFL